MKTGLVVKHKYSSDFLFFFQAEDVCPGKTGTLPVNTMKSTEGCTDGHEDKGSISEVDGFSHMDRP